MTFFSPFARVSIYILYTCLLVGNEENETSRGRLLLPRPRIWSVPFWFCFVPPILLPIRFQHTSFPEKGTMS